MATETLLPSGVASSANLVNDTNVLADDTSWATASSNNSDSIIIVDFPTPSGNPTTGAGLQGCTVKYRVTANASSVTFDAYILEGGTRLNGGAAVDSWTSTSTTEATREVTWDASILGTADGSAVQLEVYATKSGGSPSNRTAGEFQFVDWDVTYSGADALLADDVESTTEVTTPTLVELVTHNLLADDVESLSEVTVPAATGVNGILADDVQSLSEVSVPAATGVNGMLATSVESLSELTTPTLSEGSTTDSLLADDVESLSEVTVPTATGVNGMLATSVESLSEVTTPSATGVNGMLAASVESLSEVSSPSATGVNSMLATSVESLSELTTPNLAEAGTDSLFAEDVQVLAEVSTPSLNGAEYGYRIDGMSMGSIPSNTTVSYYYNGSGYHSF